jgi:hypothetical protein
MQRIGASNLACTLPPSGSGYFVVPSTARWPTTPVIYLTSERHVAGQPWGTARSGSDPCAPRHANIVRKVCDCFIGQAPCRLRRVGPLLNFCTFARFFHAGRAEPLRCRLRHVLTVSFDSGGRWVVCALLRSCQRAQKNSARFLEALIRASGSDRNLWIGKER